ncbi:MAG: iron ABC transporter permease [Clostridioides sp.]|nr:iron ABC transporter permease [Clostridioides sp.]
MENRQAGINSYKSKLLIGILFSAIIISIGTSVGSSNIGFTDTISVILEKMTKITFNDIDSKTVSIVWNLRLPRVILAFLVGGSLSISGSVVQSILKNELASPYTLGVSAGASLGAGAVIITGLSLPLIGQFTMPLVGFLFAMATIYFVILIASKLDKTMSNNTIVLFGMVFSLFVNAILTTLTAMFQKELKSIVMWQMGSFAMRGWLYVKLIIPFFIIGTLGVLRYTKEMDILTFGEEQARSVGVETTSVRKKLFIYSTILTGGAVSLSGTIGFVDLIAPHVARKIVGSAHKYVIPMSFMVGGSLMVVTDLISRTIISPAELPVGAITALIGAPFFAWVYFSKKK